MDRILIITSCTGIKTVSHDRQLTNEDILTGPDHVAKRERELASCLTKAEELYSGQQHQRLMRGMAVIRKSKHYKVELQILSAGYGLVRGSKKLAPYDATFNGMKKQELADWAQHLNVPRDIRKALAKPFDLVLVLLGDGYLRACEFDTDVTLGGPALFFMGKALAKRMPELPNLQAHILGNPDTRKFACGLVGLKGEVAARLLEKLAADELTIETVIADSATVVSQLASAPAKPKAAPVATKANPRVDKVISIPQSWWDKPHRKKIRYFIPEWDDLVDPDYDFATDTHSGGRGDWSNEVYAHQLYGEPSYDGILVSRAVAEKTKKKDARLNEMGVHRFLRVPRNYPIMGDCGAFDYIDKDEPPYTTEDVIDYYTRLDFDYGVSVDHLVVPAFADQKQKRYDLTVHNAELFINEHRRQGLNWEPIGAVQGWDVRSYADAAKKEIAMGYRYIALGGLVRSQTPEVLRTVSAVRDVVSENVQIHVLGFSRFDAVPDLLRAGANSIDSASMLRKAWLGANLNYLTPDRWFPAIRIPQAQGSFRAKRLVQKGKVPLPQLQKLEENCLREIRSFAKGSGLPSKTLVGHLVEYDTLLAGERPGTEKRIYEALAARPWAQCGCEICKTWGIEVFIFRGNNRNRRRGFHNTYVFYRLMQDMANGIRSALKEEPQMDMLSTTAVVC